MFLYDVGKASKVRPELLCELFDMTPAEARGLQVLQGGGGREMAQRSGVSVNTFKTQLHQAYVKSQTHRQADLLKLLLAIASGGSRYSFQVTLRWPTQDQSASRLFNNACERARQYSLNRGFARMDESGCLTGF